MKRICDNCLMFEQFAPETEEFFNKCGLLDIWNIEECDSCEHHKPKYKPKPATAVMIDTPTKYRVN